MCGLLMCALYYYCRACRVEMYHSSFLHHIINLKHVVLCSIKTSTSQVFHMVCCALLYSSCAISRYPTNQKYLYITKNRVRTCLSLNLGWNHDDAVHQSSSMPGRAAGESKHRRGSSRGRRRHPSPAQPPARGRRRSSWACLIDGAVLLRASTCSTEAPSLGAAAFSTATPLSMRPPARRRRRPSRRGRLLDGDAILLGAAACSPVPPFSAGCLLYFFYPSDSTRSKQLNWC